jgi:hypothetical protein
MELNIHKTKFFSITHKTNIHFYYYVIDVSILHVTVKKDLGVMLTVNCIFIIILIIYILRLQGCKGLYIMLHIISLLYTV